MFPIGKGIGALSVWIIILEFTNVFVLVGIGFGAKTISPKSNAFFGYNFCHCMRTASSDGFCSAVVVLNRGVESAFLSRQL